MAFEKIVPEWGAAGSEPPASLKESGFTAGYKPPAAYFNWFWHGMSEAVKEIQDEAYPRAGAYGGDMNELVTAGQYMLRENVNLPAKCYYGQCFVGRGSSNGDTVSQLVIGYANKYMAFRGGQNKDGAWNWEAWSEVYTTQFRPSLNAVSWLGANPVKSADEDTTAKWSSFGSGFAQYNTAGCITGQPSRYGFVESRAYGSDIYQIWYTLPNGAIYRRGGNADGWYGTWEKVYDTQSRPVGTYTGNSNAAKRTIEIGGSGKFLLTMSLTGNLALITPQGAFYVTIGNSDTTEPTIGTISSSHAKFSDGVLTLATDSTVVNANGITYTYQVL